MSAPETGILLQLQQIVVGLLANDYMFLGNQSANGQPITIITEKIGDIITELNIKIESTGLCAIVQTPNFKFTNAWVSQPGATSYDGIAKVEIMVIENVTLNQATGGTNIQALSVAERILRLLHGQATGLPDNPNSPSHLMADPESKQLDKTQEGPPLVYTTFFQAHLTLLTPDQ